MVLFVDDFIDLVIFRVEVRGGGEVEKVCKDFGNLFLQ